MNIFEIMTVVKTALEAENVPVTCDPYTSFKHVLQTASDAKLVLLETGDDHEIQLTGDGKLHKGFPELSITCMINAQNTPYEVYKPAILAYSKIILELVTGIDDEYNMSIKSVRQMDGETMLDSMKVSQVTFTIKYDTNID